MNGTGTGTWRIEYQDGKHQKEVEEKYKSDTKLEKRWKDFERDVTHNPYYHPKPKRIEKLKDTSFGKGKLWRYRNEPIRVVYYPEGREKIIYPISVTNATDAPYKRRSSK